MKTCIQCDRDVERLKPCGCCADCAEKNEADWEPNYDYSDGTDEGLVIAMIDARKLK